VENTYRRQELVVLDAESEEKVLIVRTGRR
jgi:hypothetical protein